MATGALIWGGGIWQGILADEHGPPGWPDLDPELLGDGLQGYLARANDRGFLNKSREVPGGGLVAPLLPESQPRRLGQVNGTVSGQMGQNPP